MLSFQKFISELFLSLESFLKKASELNIFDALIFHYQIKLSNVEKCGFQVAENFIQLCDELQNALKEIINAFSMGYKLITSRTSDILFTTVPANQIVVSVPQNPAVVSTCTDSIATTVTTSSVSATISSGICSVQNQDTTLLQHRTNTNEEPVVTEWMEIEPDIGAPLATKDSTKNLPEPNAKENDSGADVEQKTDVINKITPTHVKCDVCNRKFRTRVSLTRHTCKPLCPDATVPNHCDESSECVDDPCSRTDSTTSENGKANELPLYVCSICFTTYCQLEKFERHVCKEGDEQNKKPELITSLHQLEIMKRFSCGICCEVYRSYARIMYHVVRCRSGPYDCELCYDTFVNKQELNRHKKKCHKGVESFFCEECGQGFQLRASLQKHLVNRHENEPKIHICDVGDCKVSFKKRIYLTNHKINYHKIERKYLCQVCGKKFLSQQSLTYHLDAHSEKDKYKCHICSKVLRTKEKLTFHVRIHTGERPYACETCTKSFISKYKLDEHLRRHRGEKQYKCDACNKAYANKFDLKKHIRRFPEGTHYSKTCPNIGSFNTERDPVIAITTTIITPSTTTVSTAASIITGTSVVDASATTDSPVTTFTSTTPTATISTSTPTVTVTCSSSTVTTSSTAAVMNVSVAGASTLTFIDVTNIKPEPGETSTAAAILNTTVPASEINYTVTKSSNVKTTPLNVSTNKNTTSVISISEQLETAGLENTSTHVNLTEQISATGNTPTQVYIQPVGNCPSRVVVHLDNAGQIIPLSVPVHFLDPNLQFFHADPVQLIQTVTVPSQNIVNSYDNATF